MSAAGRGRPLGEGAVRAQAMIPPVDVPDTRWKSSEILRLVRLCVWFDFGAGLSSRGLLPRRVHGKHTLEPEEIVCTGSDFQLEFFFFEKDLRTKAEDHF
jgi:hypothetical protein